MLAEEGCTNLLNDLDGHQNPDAVRQYSYIMCEGERTIGSIALVSKGQLDSHPTWEFRENTIASVAPAHDFCIPLSFTTTGAAMN